MTANHKIKGYLLFSSLYIVLFFPLAFWGLDWEDLGFHLSNQSIVYQSGFSEFLGNRLVFLTDLLISPLAYFSSYIICIRFFFLTLNLLVCSMIYYQFGLIGLQGMRRIAVSLLLAAIILYPKQYGLLIQPDYFSFPIIFGFFYYFLVINAKNSKFSVWRTIFLTLFSSLKATNIISLPLLIFYYYPFRMKNKFFKEAIVSSLVVVLIQLIVLNMGSVDSGFEGGESAYLIKSLQRYVIELVLLSILGIACGFFIKLLTRRNFYESSSLLIAFLYFAFSFLEFFIPSPVVVSLNNLKSSSAILLFGYFVFLIFKSTSLSKSFILFLLILPITHWFGTLAGLYKLNYGLYFVGVFGLAELNKKISYKKFDWFVLIALVTCIFRMYFLTVDKVSPFDFSMVKTETKAKYLFTTKLRRDSLESLNVLLSDFVESGSILVAPSFPLIYYLYEVKPPLGITWIDLHSEQKLKKFLSSICSQDHFVLLSKIEPPKLRTRNAAVLCKPEKIFDDSFWELYKFTLKI